METLDQISAEIDRWEVVETGAASPALVFKAMRSQVETYGGAPDYTIKSLAHLPTLVATLAA
jgi:hypothetical protein